MDTELLRTFLEVRDTRHFGRAAQNLFITQAAVSARIKQLEETLGVSLFIRRRNNIQLSTEGERLVPHAESVLQALSLARRDVAPDNGAARRIRLGVRAGIWGTGLQQRLEALQAAESGLVVQLQSLAPEEVSRKLLDHSLHLGILYEPPGLPELTCLPIGELNLTLYGVEETAPAFYRQLSVVYHVGGSQGELVERIAHHFASGE
jgi:DNA-binding transcriptional LysR family regulator